MMKDRVKTTLTMRSTILTQTSVHIPSEKSKEEREDRLTSEHGNSSEFLQSNDARLIIPEEGDPSDGHGDRHDDPSHDEKSRNSIRA